MAFFGLGARYPIFALAIDLVWKGHILVVMIMCFDSLVFLLTGGTTHGGLLDSL